MSWAGENLDAGRREQIARECFQVKETRGDELHGICPAHGESNPSFSYNFEKDVCHCLSCGFSGDLVTLWAVANNIGDNKQAFKAFVVAHGDSETHGKGRSCSAGDGGGRGGGKAVPESTLIIDEKEWLALSPLPEKTVAMCGDKFGWSVDVLRRFDIRVRDGKKDTRIAIPVRQDDGALVNVRLYLPGAAENKIISWGKGYGKAKLFPAPATWGDDPVLLCEGEKDTLTAISYGFNGVTQTAGVSSWDHKRFNRFFAGRKVVIAYDHDEPGRIGAEKVAKSLSQVAASVRVIRWPSFMQEKQDVCDYFVTHGKTAEEFRQLIADAEKVAAGDNRARSNRAEEIPEELQNYFIGKQFKPRLAANKVMSETALANDPRIGKTFQWDGRHWKEVHESIIRKAVLNLLLDEGTTARVNDVSRIVQDLTVIGGDRAFNDRGGVLPLKNGMFNLQNGVLEPHHMDNLNNYCLSINLRASMEDRPKCPVFSGFMQSFVPDDGARREVLKFAAYCMTRETNREKALFLVGPGGDGKSTFIKLLEAILGEVNVSNVSLGALDDQFQRVQIKDKLLNVSTEVEGGLLQSNMFKALVSGDRITASYKHKDSFSFEPVAKHIFAANKFPTIQDTTRGFLRKIIVVEVQRNFSAIDMELKQKMLEEVDAIFLMLVRHLQLLHEEGFKDEEVDYLVKCKAHFAESNNPVIGFIDMRLDKGEYYSSDSMEVYKAYQGYCFARGYKAKSEMPFGKELKSLLPQLRKDRESTGARKYKYHGIGLVLE